MPGSGPPVPDAVLDAIRDGATFARVRGELGALDVGGVLQRLVVVRSQEPRGAWALDPDAGSYLDVGTFEALRAWAISASREAPISFDEGQAFGLALLPESVGGVGGVLIARVVVTGPAELEQAPTISAR